MTILLRIGLGWIGALRTKSSNPRLVSRILRASLLAPVYTTIWAVWQLRFVIGRRLVAEGKTGFGKKFRCSPPDLIQSYILMFGTWEPDLTQIISERLREGDVFIDVGANIGYFTMLASTLVGDNGTVVAIDASPLNYAELQHNIASNKGTANVRTLNLAVSDSHGTLNVYAGPAHNAGLATTAPRPGNYRPEATVVSAPLADLLHVDEIKRARILKIDVEGAEAGVLAGIGPFLHDCSRDLEILLELSPAWWSDPSLTPEKVLQPLRDAGFSTYLIDNDYSFWRYLWPNAVRQPRHVERLSDNRVKRIDLMLSRVDSSDKSTRRT